LSRFRPRATEVQTSKPQSRRGVPIAKKKAVKKSSGKGIPTKHKKGRYEGVEFVFYNDSTDLLQKGTVLIRDDAMVLEIPEQDGYPHVLIVGKPQSHYFRGSNTSREKNALPVDARWADVGNMFVGSWQDNDYDLIFYFELPG